MKKPIVSVLTATHNENPSYLKEFLTSLQNQTLSEWELILINDASNAEASRQLTKLTHGDKRISLIANKSNLGLTASLNKALTYAKGTFIARLDTDDRATPERLAHQVDYLTAHPDVAACGTWADVINEHGAMTGVRQGPTDYAAIRATLIAKNPFVHSSLMFRHECLTAVGGYDPSFRLAQDYDLMLRLAARYSVAIIPEPLTHYRENQASLSFQKMRTSLRFALQARWTALTRYGYPAWMAIYLIKPAVSYLIPVALKQRVYQWSMR